MKRDSLFFRFFQELPGCFFRLVGRPEDDAGRYHLESVEFKDTAVRLDGVFQPRRPGADPVYIWEAQYYTSDKVYANLLSKVGRFLEHGDPAQDWDAVVIYPNRALEQTNLRPYRWLLASDQLVRVYQDELPPAPPDNFEMGVLELIAAKPDAALAKARAMVPRLRASNRPDHFRRTVVQFVETIVPYQFPNLSRREIEKMLQVSDVRQTRVFQEALEEGHAKGREEGIEAVAVRLLALGRPVAEIAQATGLTPAKIRALKKKSAGK